VVQACSQLRQREVGRVPSVGAAGSPSSSTLWVTSACVVGLLTPYRMGITDPDPHRGHTWRHASAVVDPGPPSPLLAMTTSMTLPDEPWRA
jgi:hypothetical protein